MDAAAIKEVKVMLKSDDEIAALSGGKKPRRKRGTRKQGGGAATATDASPESGRVADAGGSLSPMAAAMAEGPAARVEKLGSITEPIGVQSSVSGEARGAPLIGGGGTYEPISPLAVGLSVTPPAEVKPTLSTTSVGGGTAAPVVIGGKRGTGLGTVNTVGGASSAVKIIPTKRRPVNAAPAPRTFKKAKFMVGGAETPGTPSAPPGGGPVSGPPSHAGGAAKQTRRFKERKIKFTVKSSRASKEIRVKIKARVRAMSLHDVRKILLAKGIIKVAAAEKLPEEMLRNMLRDYMLLHNAE
jgi:hypothetical protein